VFAIDKLIKPYREPQINKLFILGSERARLFANADFYEPLLAEEYAYQRAHQYYEYAGV